MGRKKDKSGLGKAIIRDRFGGKNKQKTGESFLHTSELEDGYDWGRLNLQSVTEQSNLDEFLATAELAGTQFTAEKLNIHFVNPESYTGLLTEDEAQKVKETQDQHREFLRIPRRPEWDETTTPDELDQRERTTFLAWRRKLAELQDVEGLMLTPFERNLDFWRQLWRVIERSDVVVQIVDARNPLLFRSEDLERYVKEVGSDKQNMILINKADFLSEKQRIYWAQFFDKAGIKVAFWSAVREAERIAALNKQQEEASDGEDSEKERSSEEEDDEDPNVHGIETGNLKTDHDSANACPQSESRSNEPSPSVSRTSESSNMKNRDSGIESSIVDSLHPQQCDKTKNCGVSQETEYENRPDNSHPEAGHKESPSALNSGKPDSLLSNDPSILTGDELVDVFKSLHCGQKAVEGVTTIGLVGYPNVGKSSTINAILHMKKVPVSSTPGRTKHFQTLYLEDSLMLCDCPGLVMPTFVSTKAEMVISGILPIDQMKDCVPPVTLLCRHIPRKTLEAMYGIMIPPPQEGEDPDRPPTAHELLGVYGCMRGFMTHKGIPDFPRSARCVLKDYVNGKLLYCHPPPDISPEDFKSAPDPPEKVSRLKKDTASTPNTNKTRKMKPLYSNDVDRQFFGKVESSIGSKGVHGGRGVSQTVPMGRPNAGETSSLAGSMQSLGGKPWKKHGNRNKKEKLRRTHGYLDS